MTMSSLHCGLDEVVKMVYFIWQRVAGFYSLRIKYAK